MVFQTHVMDDIRALEAEILRTRASYLLPNDERKLAFEQSRTEKRSTSFFACTANKGA